MRASTLFGIVLAAAIAGAGYMIVGPAPSVTTATAANAVPGIAITTVTVANFDAEVLKSDLPVVIDNYADWCGPCRSFAPTYDGTATDYAGKAKFTRLDVETATEVFRLFGARAIPTIVVIKKDAAGNHVFYKISGAISQAKLKAFIDDAISGNTPGQPLPALK